MHCSVEAGVAGGAEFARRSAITRGISQDRMRYEIPDSRTKLQVSETPFRWQTVPACLSVRTLTQPRLFYTPAGGFRSGDSSGL